MYIFAIENIFTLVTLLIAGWHIYGLRKLSLIEKDILRVKSEIDNMEKTQHVKTAGWVNQSQFEKIVEHARKPLVAEFETLELKRQFILDKFPLLGFFKH
jgi:hypothetical protein